MSQLNWVTFLFLKLPDSFFTNCAQNLKGNTKSFSDIVCRVRSDRIDRSGRFLLLGMRRWPYWPCHAAQARDGVELAVLQSYCWMYSTLRIPLEYKGACSGQRWLNIYSRDLYKRCGSDIVLLLLISGIPISLHSRGRPGRECELYRVQHVLPVGAALSNLHGLCVLPAAHVLAQHGGRPHEVPLQGDNN